MLVDVVNVGEGNLHVRSLQKQLAFSFKFGWKKAVVSVQVGDVVACHGLERVNTCLGYPCVAGVVDGLNQVGIP